MTAILDVAAEMLESAGLDGLQLREVAAAAKVSLSTVYKYFPSRDDLVVAAVEDWMAANVYHQLSPPPDTGHLADDLVAFLREFFAPWAAHPTMLTVFLQASLLPGGDRLPTQGFDAARLVGAGLFAGYDADFTVDMQTILGLLTEGLMNRFSAGQIDMDQILDIYERAVRRLTATQRAEPLRA